MERAQRILKKFSKILKEQGAGPLFTTFKGYVTYALYDRWKVRRLRKFPPRMVKNRILFETNDDFTDNCRALFDYMVANGYNKCVVRWSCSNMYFRDSTSSGFEWKKSSAGS